MRRCIIILSLLVAATAPALADDSCRPVPAAQVALSLPSNDHPSVPVTLSGKDFVFAVDTGAAQTQITQAVADTLGLKIAPIGHVSMEVFGGSKVERYATLPDLALGGLSAPGLAVPILPAGVLSPALSGILGSNVLRAYDADFDFAGGKLTLLQPGACPEALWSAPGRVAIPFELGAFGKINLTAQIDGKDVEAVIDTGAVHMILELETAERLFGFDAKDTRLQIAHVANGRTYYKFPFKTLTLGGVTIADPPVTLMSRADSHDTNQRMLVGMSVLRRFHMLIAYRQQKLYLAPAAVP